MQGSELVTGALAVDKADTVPAFLELCPGRRDKHETNNYKIYCNKNIKEEDLSQSQENMWAEVWEE